MALEAGSVYAVLGGRFNPAGFAQFDGAMKKSVASTKSAESAMASSFARTGAATKAMAGSATAAAAQLQAAQLAQQKAALRVESATAAAAAATKRHGGESVVARQRTLQLAQAQQQLATANTNLAKASAAHAAAQGQLTAKQSAGSKAAQALGLTSRNVATAGIAAVGFAIYGSLKASANFQKELASLGAVTGASGAQLKSMGDAAMTVGAKTGTGASRAAQAMTELAKGGLDASTATQALAGTVAMAQAGGLDLATAGETVANALNLFSMEGDQATLVADAFANAANSTTADIGFFSQGMAQGGAAAKAAGLDFQETTVFLEAMAANGFKSGSDAGTSMKTALIQLANPTKRAAEEASKLGVTFFKTNGDMKSLPTISKQLGTAWEGLSRKEKLASAARLAGTDGMRALFALVDQGPGKLKRFADANGKTGTAARVAKEKMNSLSGQTQRLSAEVENLGIKLGQKLEPSLRDAAGGLADFFAQMREGRGFGGTVGTILTQLGRVQQTIWAMGTGNLDWLNMSEIWGQGFTRAAIKILGVLRAVGVAMKLVGLASQEDIDRIDRTTNKLRNLEVKQRVSADVSNAVNALSKLNRYKLAPKVQKILMDGDRSAKEKINALVRQGIPRKVAKVMLSGDTSVRQKIRMLEAIGINPKYAKVIARNLTKEGIADAKRDLGRIVDRKLKIFARNETGPGIAQAQGALRALPPSYIPIYGKYAGTVGAPGGKRAAGRGAGNAETSLVGEGGGPEYVVNSRTGQSMRVDGPMVMGLGPNDYVIPTETRYRARANDLIVSLAKDLGIVGYGGGRKGKGRGKATTPLQAFTRHPMEWYDDQISGLQSTAGRKDKKGKPTPGARKAKRKLAAMRKERSKAKQYQRQIDAATTEADIQGDVMSRAETNGDQKLYGVAFGKRRAQIAKAIQLLSAAVGVVSKGPYEQSLRGQLERLRTDQATLIKGGGKLAGLEGFTDAESGRLTQFEAALSLAQVDTPNNIADDRAALVKKRDYLAALLAGARRKGATPGRIKTIADALKSTRDEITSLTETGGGLTADQQAQLDQRMNRERIAAQSSFIDRLANATIGGAGQTLVFQSYVPPSPTEAKRLADYTVGGIGYQGGRPSSTERIGV